MDIEKLKQLAGLSSMGDADMVPPEGDCGCEEEPEVKVGTESPLTGTDPCQDIVIAVVANPEAADRLRAHGVEQVGENSFAVEDADSFMSFMEENGYALEEDFDLNNGYRDRQQHQEIGGYGDDYFPKGQTGTPRRRQGPGAATHGSNPLHARQFTEDASDVHEKLVYEYREFKAKS